jgi:hypothetical protein
MEIICVEEHAADGAKEYGFGCGVCNDLLCERCHSVWAALHSQALTPI